MEYDDDDDEMDDGRIYDECGRLVGMRLDDPDIKRFLRDLKYPEIWGEPEEGDDNEMN